MNKKFLYTTIALTTLFFYSNCYAADNIQNEIKNNQINSQEHFQRMPHKFDFDNNDENFNHHHHPDKFHPSKAEMEKKKAEMEKRLKLTKKQKKLIEENRKEGHEKVKPIFQQKHEKMLEIKKIYNDNSLTKEQKQNKITPLKEDIKKLNEQANFYREENIKSFESVLTEKQKKEFNKIKEEQKKDMAKRRAELLPPPPKVEQE